MKYNIEGNINFFSELYKSLDEEEDQNKKESDNICLITNKPLIDKFVELNCGHKFNYIPLYNDIYNHKKKFNNMEGPVSLLKINEIRCPYCRKKQQDVLPYYPELVTEKINGVNFYDTSLLNNISSQSNLPYSFGKCEFIISAPLLESNQLLNLICPITYVRKIDCDNKTYCWRHGKIINTMFEKEKKQKEKEAQKKLKDESKQKEKEEKNKIKEEEKQKKIAEKILKKKQKNNKNLINVITDIEEENVVISSTPQIQNNNEGCSQIIKTGTNKGNHCGLSIFNDCLCKRHYNLKNKNIIINNNINI